MNTAIIYYSKHHGNTKKLLDAIVEADKSVVLFDVTKQKDADLSSFDRIGFASGIYLASYAKQIVSFAEAHLPENKDVFYIYTHGAPVGGFLTSIRKIAQKKHCRELGKYHCYGFDTDGFCFPILTGVKHSGYDTSVLKIVGGRLYPVNPGTTRVFLQWHNFWGDFVVHVTE